MTDLETYRPTNGVAIASAAPVFDDSEIRRWALDVREVHTVSMSLAKTSFVPKSMQGKPEEITATILAGQEVGLKPMAALRAIDIIQGTPAMRAITMRAIVQAAGHDIWVKENTDTRAVVEGRRKGSEQVQRSVWSMDRAKKMKLDGKENWRTQPGAMLIARATAECARLIAADALMGMPYAIEELDDGGSAKSTPVQRAPRQRAPEPEAPAPDEGEPGITPAQMKKVHASFGDLAVTERDDRLNYVNGVIGREVTTSSDLTSAEASRVIEQLTADIQGRGDARPEDDPWNQPAMVTDGAGQVAQ